VTGTDGGVVARDAAGSMSGIGASHVGNPSEVTPGTMGCACAVDGAGHAPVGPLGASLTLVLCAFAARRRRRGRPRDLP
jgi:MYXO-CTERM domain-containing protein